MRVTVLALLFLSASQVTLSQVSDQQNLAGCQARVQQLQQWIDTYYPIGQRLEAENKQLKQDMEEKDAGRYLLSGLGIAIGGGFLYAIYRGIKRMIRWWPQSKQRRQLVILLLMATWITVAAMIALSDSRLSYHPVNLVLSVFVYSLPALSFGSVAVWWFGRTKPEVLW
jgi:hypothetical protein